MVSCLKEYGSADQGGDNQGVPIEWLSSGPEDYIALENPSGGTGNVTVDLIRVTPALNCYLQVPGIGYAYAKIPSIKTVELSLIEDYEGPNEEILRTMIINFQKWQTTDPVVSINSSLTEEDVVVLGDNSAIKLQVLEVWNEDYRGIIEETGTEIYDENISTDCFGGIAEVYLYGNTYSVGNYDNIATKVDPFIFPEDCVRFNDAETMWAVDGGSYFTDGDNSAVRRSMNGGTYQVTINAGRKSDSIGGLRFNADYGVIFKTSSITMDHVVRAEWMKEIAHLKETILMSTIYNILFGAACAVISVLLFGTGVGSGGGLMALGRVAISFAAVASGISALSKILAYCGHPAAAALLGTVMQLVDLSFAFVINLICELSDLGLNVASYFFIGRYKEQHFFRETLQPLAYGLYMVSLDWKGTVTRLCSRECLKEFQGATEEEIQMILFNNYELAMLRGEAYNFLDLAIYFNGNL